MTLRTRVFLRVTMLLILLILAISAVYAAFVVHHHRKEVVERFGISLQARSDDIERLMLWDDRVGLKRALEIMGGESSRLTRYAFIEKGGQPYVHTFPDGVPRKLLGRQLSAAGPTVWRFRTHEGAPNYDVMVQVGETGAVLHVGLSRREIDREVQPILAGIAVLDAIAILAGGLLSLLFARWTTQEVHQLTGNLRQSRDFLQTVIDGNPDPMMVIDRDHRITLANGAVRKMGGERASADDELKCHQVLHRSDVPCDSLGCACPLDQVVATKAPVTVIHTHFDEDGKKIFAEVSAAPILNEAGEVTQVIESCRDVTGRIRAEEERRGLETQVQEAQKLESLGVLAGGVAQSFSNLLTSVLGNVDLARADLSPVAAARDNIGEIEKAALRATELCRQMQAYSGNDRPLVEPININDVVRGMTHLLDASVGKKIRLEYDLTDDLPAIDGDPAQIRQAIMNLAANASDAIGIEGGRVSISTGLTECNGAPLDATWLGENLRKGPCVHIEIADTGRGMDEDTRRRIFDPFFTTKPTGRGLGLAVVLGIVRGHRGAVKVQSEPGRGTTFTILLPALDRPAERADRESSYVTTWRGKGTVLLVDDEESIRSVGKRILEKLGFSVLTADDGREALEVFRDHANDVVCILLDLTMPSVQGEGTLYELRRIRSDVPVVLSSTRDEQELADRFAGECLAGFIQKPYRASQLIERFRQVLQG